MSKRADYFKSKMFVRSFVSYLIIFLMLIALFFGLLYGMLASESRKKLLHGYDENAVRMAALADSYFNANNRIVNYLKNSQWVYNLTSQTEAFSGELDISRQKEHSYQLSYLTTESGGVVHIGVVYPYADLAVTSVGRFGYTDYASFLKRKYNIETEDFFDKMSGKSEIANLSSNGYNYQSNEYLILFCTLETMKSPRAYTAIVAEKKLINEYLHSIAEPNLMRFEVAVNAVNMCGFKTDKQLKLYSKEIKSSVINASYKLDYLIQGNSFWWLILPAFLCMITGGFISYLLAKQNYKPMKNLVERISAYSAENSYDIKPCKSNDVELQEYSYIEEFFREMSEDNRSMQGKVELYYHSARDSLLLQLLRGHFKQENLTQILAQLGLDYAPSGSFLVFLIEECNPRPSQEDYEMVYITRLSLLKTASHFDVADLLDSRAAVIFNAQQEPNCGFKICAEELKDNLEQNLGIEVRITIGECYSGLIGISKSYQDAKIKADSVGKSPVINECYFPLDWEVQLISAIQQGDSEETNNILKELDVENRLHGGENLLFTLTHKLLDLFNRVGKTINAEEQLELISMLQQSKKVEWLQLLEVANQLCGLASSNYSKKISDMKKEIYDYVTEHCYEAELSLKSLSQLYHMSVVSVSRLFKEASGENFCDYLTSQRMEKAKKLLTAIGYDLSYITKAVGYENEYSFKRAFLRNTGEKPRDYAQRNTNKTT